MQKELFEHYEHGDRHVVQELFVVSAKVPLGHEV